MRFRELADEEWARIRPHLPPTAKRGRPRADDRGTLNGILYVLLSGCRWMDMPAVYGSHKTGMAATEAVGAGGRVGASVARVSE